MKKRKKRGYSVLNYPDSNKPGHYQNTGSHLDGLTIHFFPKVQPSTTIWNTCTHISYIQPLTVSVQVS